MYKTQKHDMHLQDIERITLKRISQGESLYWYGGLQLEDIQKVMDKFWKMGYLRWDQGHKLTLEGWLYFHSLGGDNE
jgi:hypothetical protein